MEDNSKRYCVYCGSANNLTKEHVFPNFIYKIIKQKQFSSINGVENIFVGAPTIRDVCNICNNGVLSELDSYGKTLSERYFINTVYDKVDFYYDYNLLLRWLLKVTFNGSRAFKSTFDSFYKYISYITGKSQEYPSTQLFGCIIKPSYYDFKVINPNTIAISDILIYNEKSCHLSLSKAFYFYSYMFFIVGWRKQPSKESEKQLEIELKKQYGAILIKNTDSYITLNKDFSKIDYLSYISLQQQLNPKSIKNINQLEKDIPEMRKFIIKQNQLEYSPCEVAIITANENNHDIPIFAIEKNKLNVELIINPIKVSSYKIAKELRNAIVRIKRKELRTYIDILDINDIGNPFNKDSMGIDQTQTNWELWKNAIDANNNYVYIGSIPFNHNYQNLSIVSKVKSIIL